MKDKYKAVWVSHSSIADFIACPRAYYLRNVYKDPKTRNKITVTSPALSLGTAVHEVVEELSVLPVEQRLQISLLKKFDVAWEKVTGKLGGFTDPTQEDEFKERGRVMLKRVEEHPGRAHRAGATSQDSHRCLSRDCQIGTSGWFEWMARVTAKYSRCWLL